MHCSRLPLYVRPRNRPFRAAMECRSSAQLCQLSPNRIRLYARRTQSLNVADGVCLVNLPLRLRESGCAPFFLATPGGSVRFWSIAGRPPGEQESGGLLLSVPEALGVAGRRTPGVFVSWSSACGYGRRVPSAPVPVCDTILLPAAFESEVAAAEAAKPYRDREEKRRRALTVYDEEDRPSKPRDDSGGGRSRARL